MLRAPFRKAQHSGLARNYRSAEIFRGVADIIGHSLFLGR